MCCCGTPTINGEPGYRWQPADKPSIRPVAPPTLGESDTLTYDEPGRCGGQDSHCHHYRVVGGPVFPSLLVRHGGGEERIRLSNGRAVLTALGALDSNGRYWLLNALYHAVDDARRAGREAEAARWRTAAAEKRITVRKVRGQAAVRVAIVAETDKGGA